MRQLDPADVRRNVGYVSQDVTLFYGTLRDNIVFGNPTRKTTLWSPPPKQLVWPSSCSVIPPRGLTCK